MVRRGAFLFGTVSLVVLAMAPTAVRAQDTVLLPTVSVTANRNVDTPLTAVGSAVTVITAEELEAKQVRVVADALRLVPGVSVTRLGTFGNTTSVRLRGSEGNQTLVMIDGVVVNNPASSSEFNFGQLAIQDIERIEVLRGPQSALYGSDAAGGVINIITKKGAGEPTITASIEGGSMNTLSSTVSAGAGGEGFSIHAGATGLMTSGTSSAAKWLGNGENDGFRSLSSHVNASFDPSENFGVDFVFRNTETRSEFDDTPPPAYTLSDWNSWSSGSETFGRVQARLSLFDGVWDQRVGLSHFRNTTDYMAPGLWPDNTLKGQTTNLDYQSNIAFETEAVTPADHLITFAVDHQHDKIDSYVQESLDQTSFVGQYQLGLFDGLSLTGAIRRDANEKFEDATTYRLTAAYFLASTGTKFRASYGTGVKNPTINELYGYGGSYIGNPNLAPEKAKGWDAGIDQSLFDGRLTFGATWFDQRISNEISSIYVYDPVTSVFLGSTPVNDPATSKHHGVELEMAVEPLTDLTLRATYTYTHSHDATRNTDEIRQPIHQGGFDATYRFLERRATVNLGVTFASDYTDIDYATYTTVGLGSYTLVHVAGSYALTDNVELFGRVENLGDAQYEEAYRYGAVGRAAYGGVKATF